MTVNSTELVGPYWFYARLTAAGINGKGVKRPGYVLTISSRTVNVGEDVSNQDTVTSK